MWCAHGSLPANIKADLAEVSGEYVTMDDAFKVWDFIELI